MIKGQRRKEEYYRVIVRDIDYKLLSIDFFKDIAIAQTYIDATIAAGKYGYIILDIWSEYASCYVTVEYKEVWERETI